MAILSLPAIRVVQKAGFALLALLAADQVLFHTGSYSSILAPNSAAGVFELTLRREQQAQQEGGDNLILTLGDSRFAYSPRLANQLTPRTGYVFRHAGIGGTAPRDWFYMLRDLDPTCRRYRAIVFGVNDYDDEDEYYNPNDDIRSLHYVVARLRLGDVVPFAASFQNSALRWEAFRGALFKGLVYQADVLDFFSHPGQRLRYVRAARATFNQATYNYEEPARSMAGLAIDWTTWQATFPPDSDQNQFDTVRNALMHEVAPQTGRLAAYRRLWFGRMLGRYCGSRTRILFVRLPRGPIPRPDTLVQKKSSSIREFAALPYVQLCPEHAFDSLEHTELFRDGMHLNRAGSAQFSAMFAIQVSRMLHPTS